MLWVIWKTSGVGVERRDEEGETVRAHTTPLLHTHTCMRVHTPHPLHTHNVRVHTTPPLHTHTHTHTHTYTHTQINNKDSPAYTKSYSVFNMLSV